jgi:hypothetical protein
MLVDGPFGIAAIRFAKVSVKETGAAWVPTAGFVAPQRGEARHERRWRSTAIF